MQEKNIRKNIDGPSVVAIKAHCRSWVRSQVYNNPDISYIVL